MFENEIQDDTHYEHNQQRDTAHNKIPAFILYFVLRSLSAIFPSLRFLASEWRTYILEYAVVNVPLHHRSYLLLFDD